MTRIEFVRGDITKQEVDAIVNAANSSLMGGGGVDGAIHRAGGPAILEACTELREKQFTDGLPTGAAVATEAGNLPAKWVIHTVGPVFSRSEDRSKLLASCHVEALRVADELGAKTVAFPAISTGIFGYPPHLAGPTAIGAVLDSGTAAEVVRFVFSDQTIQEFYRRALEERPA